MGKSSSKKWLFAAVLLVAAAIGWSAFTGETFRQTDAPAGGLAEAAPAPDGLPDPAVAGALSSETPAYRQAAAAIQVSSNISDGSHAIQDIADIASREGVDVVVITDRDLMRWQYGLWPLRRFIKMTVEQGSVFRYGIRRYLADVAAAQKAHPGMVILGGIESAPFYYWKENLREQRLAIKNWHKHLITVGLERPDDIRRIPVIGNTAGLALPFRFSNLGYFFFPLLLFVAGVYFLTTDRFQYARFREVRIKTGNSRARACGAILLALSAVLLAYGYPFCDLRFDQFRGDRGIMPYQQYIDYVNAKGGMAFWVHPEAENAEHTTFVDIFTPEHSEALLQSRDYTGFSVFYNGYDRVGKPGGIWDEVLNEYCEDRRHRPVWAIGCLGIDKTADLGECLRALRTMLLVPALDRKSVLEALAAGRAYIVEGKNAPRFVLDRFVVRDPAAPESGAKVMGEELVTRAAPLIEIQGRFTDRRERQVKIDLIRNGIIIKSFETKAPFSVEYRDEYATDRPRNYYRVEVRAEGVQAITNPIFVLYE